MSHEPRTTHWIVHDPREHVPKQDEHETKMIDLLGVRGAKSFDLVIMQYKVRIYTPHSSLPPQHWINVLQLPTRTSRAVHHQAQ